MTAEEVRLDLRGLKCPLPALKTRAALARLAPHTTLVVEATDPMAAIDIPHLIAQTGDVLAEQNLAGPVLIFRIRKASGRPRRAPLSREDHRDGET